MSPPRAGGFSAPARDILNQSDLGIAIFSLHHAMAAKTVVLAKHLAKFQSVLGRRLLYPEQARINMPGLAQAFPLDNSKGRRRICPDLTF